MEDAADRIPGLSGLTVARITLDETLEHGAGLIVTVLIPQERAPLRQHRGCHGAVGVLGRHFFPDCYGIFDPPLPFVDCRQDGERHWPQGTYRKPGRELLYEFLSLASITLLGQEADFIQVFLVVLEREARRLQSAQLFNSRLGSLADCRARGCAPQLLIQAIGFGHVSLPFTRLGEDQRCVVSD